MFIMYLNDIYKGNICMYIFKEYFLNVYVFMNAK